MSGGDDRGKAAKRGEKKAGKAGEEPIDFHGAAIIGEDGQEIPITEHMIKEACKKLDPTADEEQEEDA